MRRRSAPTLSSRPNISLSRSLKPTGRPPNTVGLPGPRNRGRSLQPRLHDTRYAGCDTVADDTAAFGAKVLPRVATNGPSPRTRASWFAAKSPDDYGD